MEKQIVQAFLLLLFSTGLFAQGRESSSKEPDSINNSIGPWVEYPFTSFQLQTRDNKKIILQWAMQPGISPDYFSIERNIDGKNYETIGVIKSVAKAVKYEFTDEIPTRGISLYRIKCTAKGAGHYFSDSIEVNIPGSSFISFYPNPADNVLIIRSAFHADILITDGIGKARISKSIGVGPSIIDVSTLEKGVYLLRITDKVTSQQQVEKILKN
jgi:Secretion system C-terminal sorting domain